MSQQHSGRIYIPNQSHYEGDKKDPYDLDLQEYIEDKAPAPPAPQGGSSYLVYTALLTQSGTNAPTATVLENTIGNILWEYSGTGEYTGTLTDAFTLNKTWCIIGTRDEQTQFAISTNTSVITVSTWNNGVYSNSLLSKTPIEIRVYP